MPSNTALVEQEPLSILPGRSSGGHLINTSVDFTVNHVDKELHSAFSDSGYSYDSEADRFAPETVATDGNKEPFEYQEFKDELQKFTETTRLPNTIRTDLIDNCTWDDLIEQVDIARNEYQGIDKTGIVKSIRNGFKNFAAAAPAMEQWLHLLPSTSIYGSLVCGGLTIILRAAIRLGKLSKETYEAIDEIPVRIKTAQFLMRTYECTKIEEHAANLYQAIIEALQHILTWYKRKAGMKYLGSVCKGPAYASLLKEKMKNVEKASQAMDNEADLSSHKRLEEIRNLSWQTMTQLSSVKEHQKELRDLQLEARNSLYAIFKDKEAWQALQSWASSETGKRSRRSSINQQERRIAARNALLSILGNDSEIISRNVDYMIQRGSSLNIKDQDRATAIIVEPFINQWIVETESAALLVHGNCRRHDPISPTSVASAVLVSLFKNQLHFITLQWFCGTYKTGPNGNARGMMRSLVCQILSGASFIYDFELPSSIDGEDLGELLKLFKKLVRRLPAGSVVICIIDGISWYEDRRLRDDTIKSLRKIVKLMKAEELIFKLLLTSPTRTSYILGEPALAEDIQVVEIPEHISGVKQGFDHRTVAEGTEGQIRKFSASSGSGLKVPWTA